MRTRCRRWVYATTVAALAIGVSVAELPLPACASPSTDCEGSVNLVGGHGARVPAKHGTVWALPLGPTPISASNPLKVVWRVTGSGLLRVRLQSPEGSRVPLVAGPTLHTSSTFIHPGAEYGTVFEFDRPGCWTIRLARAKTRATVKLLVA